MRKVLLICLAAALFAGNGMIAYKSRYNVDETTKRLVAMLREKGVTLFKVVDHSDGAHSAGMQMKPMKLVIFGNPKMGTPLMQCAPTLGLDLPQKMLIYENNASETVVVYNSPKYLFWRHDVPETCAPGIQKKMGAVLQRFAKYAAGIR
ncbi:DUF302 domain-containing protein [Hydrogenimonas sp. SS33]|uniref:DUF302 domain-containing protein n=1 Tax=Hydrogenimonas leucolamina TaxID=2954236 RepID=UPI00336C0743